LIFSGTKDFGAVPFFCPIEAVMLPAVLPVKMRLESLVYDKFIFNYKKVPKSYKKQLNFDKWVDGGSSDGVNFAYNHRWKFM